MKKERKGEYKKGFPGYNLKVVFVLKTTFYIERKKLKKVSFTVRVIIDFLISLDNFN